MGGFESIVTFGLSSSSTPNANTAVDAGGGSQIQKILSTGDGPIWTIRWTGDIIAWAVDTGVRLYSVGKGEKIAFIQRDRESPRADLFACSLTWLSRKLKQRGNREEDYEELLIGWADLVKVVRVTLRPKAIPGGGTGYSEKPSTSTSPSSTASTPQGGIETVVEVTKVLRLDCMITGVAYWPFLQEPAGKDGVDVIKPTPTVTTVVPSSANTAPNSNATGANKTRDGQDSTHRSSFTKPKTPPTSAHKLPPQTAFLLLTYLPTKAMLSAESNADQRRQPSNPPELRIVTSEGEERSRDVLAMRGSERWGCGDYRIVESFPPPPPSFPSSQSGPRDKEKGRLKGKRVEKDHGGWLVLSPKGVVLVRKRDRRDRVMWLVERERYEEALDEMEKMEIDGDYAKLATGGRFFSAHWFHGTLTN
jgi:hypothetical protein